MCWTWQMYDGQHRRVPVDAAVHRTRDDVRLSRAAGRSLQDLRRRVLGCLAGKQRQRATLNDRAARRRNAPTSAQSCGHVSQSSIRTFAFFSPKQARYSFVTTLSPNKSTPPNIRVYSLVSICLFIVVVIIIVIIIIYSFCFSSS